MNYKNIDELARQVGGSLRLTALIISRARQIIKKASVLVETDTDDPVRIAFFELIQGKVRLNEGGSQQRPGISDSANSENVFEKSERL